MKTRHSNAYAAITVLVLVAILFIGMYSIMGPFATIFTMFYEAENSTTYNNQTVCESANSHWYDSACYKIPERARDVMYKERRVWLVAPIIFVIGLVFWFITVSVRKDPYYFQQQPPRGGFQ